MYQYSVQRCKYITFLSNSFIIFHVSKSISDNFFEFTNLIFLLTSFSDALISVGVMGVVAKRVLFLIFFVIS